MNSLVDFKENLKDSITYSILDYVNYMNETKYNADNLDNGSDTLSKCIVLCGELFANKIKKGDIKPDEIESFEALLPKEGMFVVDYKNLDLASKIVKEGDSVALNDYESTFGDTNKSISLKKVA